MYLLEQHGAHNTRVTPPFAVRDATSRHKRLTVQPPPRAAPTDVLAMATGWRDGGGGSGGQLGVEPCRGSAKATAGDRERRADSSMPNLPRLWIPVQAFAAAGALSQATWISGVAAAKPRAGSHRRLLPG
jgi:hypothetical protein